MKKVMLLAAMLAMVLAAAVPALAQVNNGNVANAACVQTAVQNQAVAQANQYGDNINVQFIAQECNIAIAQVNTIINGDDYDKDYDKDYGKKYYDKDYDKDYGKKYYYEDGKKYYYDKDYDEKYYYEKDYAAPSYQYKYEKDYAAPSYQYKYEAPSAVQYQYSSDEAAVELPSTGGSSLIALGAGVLLVAGGLLARRIVR